MVSSHYTTNTDRVNSDVKEQLVLYSKLFIVMGIAWIFECVHYLLHSDHTHTQELCYDTTELILRIIGCLNLLRGSLIFFIFVCKDSILDKVACTICPLSSSLRPSVPGGQADSVRAETESPPEETLSTFRQRHQQG